MASQELYATCETLPESEILTKSELDELYLKYQLTLDRQHAINALQLRLHFDFRSLRAKLGKSLM
jgi:hypothetical protein